MEKPATDTSSFEPFRKNGFTYVDKTAQASLVGVALDAEMRNPSDRKMEETETSAER